MDDKTKKKVKHDIKQFEKDCPKCRKFRTAHKWSDGFYDQKVTPADIGE